MGCVVLLRRTLKSKDLMCAIRDLCTKELVLLFSSEVVLECDGEEGEGFKGTRPRMASLTFFVYLSNMTRHGDG